MISQQLVRLMGGDICVESKLGEGSCFCFDLPMIYPNPIATPVKLDVNVGISPDKPHPLDALKGCILVADDNRNNRELLSRLISALGIEVHLAHNGAEALSMALQNPYDLILMDLNMPVMDGFLAAEAIWASSTINPHIPIIAVSASGDDERQKALMHGMVDFVSKPIRIDQLIQCINRWIIRHDDDEDSTAHKTDRDNFLAPSRVLN